MWRILIAKLHMMKFETLPARESLRIFVEILIIKPRCIVRARGPVTGPGHATELPILEIAIGMHTLTDVVDGEQF